MADAYPSSAELSRVAESLGVTRRTLNDWLTKQGAPVEPDGGLDEAKLRAWRSERRRAMRQRTSEQRKGQAGSDNLADLPARTWAERKTKAQALKAELELKVARGELVPRSEIEELFVRRVLEVRRGLQTLGDRLADDLRGVEDDAQRRTLIGGHVRELCDQYARPLTDDGSKKGRARRA